MFSEQVLAGKETFELAVPFSFLEFRELSLCFRRQANFRWPIGPW